jgi:hypothetical protein
MSETTLVMFKLNDCPVSYCRVISAVRSSGGISERLFNIAYNAKKHALQTGMLLASRIFYAGQKKSSRSDKYYVYCQERFHPLFGIA